MQTIRQLREARGWTQMELAYRLGTTTSAVYNWERWRHVPSVVMWRKLAQLFDVSMDDIAVENPEGKAVAAA